MSVKKVYLESLNNNTRQRHKTKEQRCNTQTRKSISTSDLSTTETDSLTLLLIDEMETVARDH